MVYRFIRKILKGASLTSALFIFEACYGTPYNIRFEDYCIRIGVYSADDMSPLEGIAIKGKTYSDDSLAWIDYGYTNVDGTAEIYVPNLDGSCPLLRFESEDGMYMAKDTVISNPGGDATIEIKLQTAK